ncbi:MAG: hypothetical protein HGB10_04020 [Coriobacteriia bacterium]|nr:hypothetical protein [Coriobacteriia bacterium]
MEEDDAVKRCLQALFTHELETADQVMPHFNAEYERAITKFAPAWDPSLAEGEAEAE